MVPFLSALLLKKSPTKSNWTGVFMALLGLVFITGIYQGITALTIGDLLTFISAIFVAIHIIVADYYLKTDDSLLLGIGQIFGGAILSIVVWTIKTPQSFLTVAYTQTLLTSVILTSLLCTCFAFTGQLIVQKHLPPARVAVLFTLEPVFAYLFALVIPGTEGVTEPLLWSKVLGCVLVVGGMIVSESGILNRGKQLPGVEG